MQPLDRSRAAPQYALGPKIRPSADLLQDHPPPPPDGRWVLRDRPGRFRSLEVELIRANRAGGCLPWVLLVYGVSFFLPAWTEINQAIYGWAAFLLGFLGCCLLSGGLLHALVTGTPLHWTASDFAGVVGIVPWLANVAFWIGLARLGRDHWRAAAILGVMAFLLGLSFFFTWRNDHLQPSVGYYVWMASMAFLAAAGGWGHWEARRGQL
jgi:hypothetical protein